jgi:hypothetical protein
LLANVTVNAYTDASATTVGAAVPGSNTTGGPSTYGQPATRQWVPYAVVAEDGCSAFGFDEHDYIGRAQRLLDMSESAAIEKELWTGTIAQAKGYPNDYLANNATVTDLTPGTVPSITRGIQILEDGIANTGAGAQGMIHVQPETTPSLLNARRVGNLLLSELDNIIVPGTGYPGTGPGGAAPASGYSWIYATNIVNVRKGPMITVPDNFAEALDWGQADQPNTIRFRAMEMACADWDGTIHLACKVSLTA